MSTYNGEKYLREQIDSILKQTQVDAQLIVRDDGSSDGTVRILEEYSRNYPNVSFYQGTNVGVGKSFLELLKNAPQADYYSFADQDDVWLEDKLNHAVSIIRQIEQKDTTGLRGEEYVITGLKREELLYSDHTSSVPVLYGSNQTLVRRYGFPLEPRFDLRARATDDLRVQELGAADGIHPLRTVFRLAVHDARDRTNERRFRGGTAERVVHILPQTVFITRPRRIRTTSRAVVTDKDIVLIHLKPVNASLGPRSYAICPSIVPQRKKIEGLARCNGIIVVTHGLRAQLVAISVVDVKTLARRAETRHDAVLHVFEISVPTSMRMRAKVEHR